MNRARLRDERALLEAKLAKDGGGGAGGGGDAALVERIEAAKFKQLLCTLVLVKIAADGLLAFNTLLGAVRRSPRPRSACRPPVGRRRAARRDRSERGGAAMAMEGARRAGILTANSPCSPRTAGTRPGRARANSALSHHHPRPRLGERRRLFVNHPFCRAVLGLSSACVSLHKAWPR